jgi:hypothetical protein
MLNMDGFTDNKSISPQPASPWAAQAPSAVAGDLTEESAAPFSEDIAFSDIAFSMALHP